MLNIIFPTLSNRARASFVAAIILIELIGFSIAGCMDDARGAASPLPPLPPGSGRISTGRSGVIAQSPRAAAEPANLNKTMSATLARAAALPAPNAFVVTNGLIFSNRLMAVRLAAGFSNAAAVNAVATNVYPAFEIISTSDLESLPFTNVISVQAGVAVFSTNIASQTPARFYSVRYLYPNP